MYMYVRPRTRHSWYKKLEEFSFISLYNGLWLRAYIPRPTLFTPRSLTRLVLAPCYFSRIASVRSFHLERKNREKRQEERLKRADLLSPRLRGKARLQVRPRNSRHHHSLVCTFARDGRDARRGCASS